MCQDGRLKKDAGLWAIFAFWLSLFLSLFFEKVSFYSEICSMLILTNKMHACFMSCVPLNSHSTNISLPAFPIFSFWLRAGVVCWLMKFSGFFRIHVQCVKEVELPAPTASLVVHSYLSCPSPAALCCQCRSPGPLLCTCSSFIRFFVYVCVPGLSLGIISPFACAPYFLCWAELQHHTCQRTGLVEIYLTGCFSGTYIHSGHERGI